MEKDIDLVSRVIPKPKLIFKDSTTYHNPFGILQFGPNIPVDSPVTFDIWAIQEQFNSYDEATTAMDKWERVLASTLSFRFRTKLNSFKELLGNSYVISKKRHVSIKNLSDEISKCDSRLIFIIHKGEMPADSYVQSKIAAKFSHRRLQFLDLSHIYGGDPFTTLNIFVQSLAKCGGTPWLVENSNPSSFLGKDSLIVGNAFSTLKGRTTYSVSHFLDIMNLRQIMKIQATTLRKDDFRGLHLTSEEMKLLLQQSVDWYLERNSRTKELNLFLYRSTPLHPDEESAINEMIGKDIQKEYTLNVTHLHLSKNRPLMRLYDSENYGLSPRFQNMGKQGQVIEMLSKETPQSDELKFMGFIVILTTGLEHNDYSQTPRGPIGTPVPLSLEVHSNASFDPVYIENQVMAMTSADWEYMGRQYNEPFILKYAYKLARYLIIWGRDGFPQEWDVRDVM